MINKQDLVLKKDQLLKDLISIEIDKKNLTKQYLEWRNEVENAKKRVELEPELKKFLENFQRKEQEKLVGINQSLLTAILQDVIRNDNDERKVVLDIFTERGLPALGIYIEKNQQGVLEDVYNGTGGAVANILSLGLRAIALIQSKKRRFLVLDEGDCWIKPEIIPDFIQVINQLSQKLNIQILVISHHDESLLQGIEHRLILEKENGKIKTQWSNGENPVWEDSDEGIRSIYLENFQSHSSTFIPLSKTVTLLTGVNDLGKSTIVNALRAVFYGQADDTNIKHFEEQAKVVVDFGYSTLFWERKLKGKPKEVYVLIDENHGFEDPLHKTESAREVPEWLEEETGIGLIEGFDIQLGHQKKPVFLLDEAPSKKAKALSIGDETNYVQKMINLSKEDLTQAKSLIKKGETEMEYCYKTLRIYEKHNEFLKDQEEKIKEIFNKTSNIIENNEKLDLLLKKYQTLLNLKAALNKLNLIENVKKTSMENINFDLQHNLKDLRKIVLQIKHLNVLKQYSQILNKQSLNDFDGFKRINKDLLIKALKFIKQNEIYQKNNIKDYEFNQNKRIVDYKAINQIHINKLKQNILNIKTLTYLNNINYSLKDFSLNKINKDLINQFMANSNQIKTLELNKEKTKKELLNTENKFKQFKMCPLCQQSLKHNH